MADAGVPEDTFRKVAGHGTLTTTLHYLDPDRQPVANAGTLFAQHLGSK